MKKLFLFALIGLLWSCTARDYVVTSDENPEVEFDNYQTFAFSSHAMNNDTRYTLGDMTVKNDIRESVSHELQSRGYERDMNNADLLVNFRVFEEPTELRTYPSDEERIYDYWTADEILRVKDAQMLEVEAGTLVVNIADAESGEIVWTGYATGILNDDNTFDTDEVAIATAVENIFDRYGYDAVE